MVVSFSLYRLLDGLRRRATSARKAVSERPSLYPYF